MIAPQLRGERPELTLRRARRRVPRPPRAVSLSRRRSGRFAIDCAARSTPMGTCPLRELEGMGGDLADFRATLPERFAHDVMRALRQTFAAGVRYGYMDSNPAVARWRQSCAEAEAGPRLHARRAGRARSRARPRRTGRFVPLVAATGCGRWSGRCSNVATSTEGDASYRATARKPRLMARGSAHAAALDALDRCLRGWIRRCCSPPRRADR